MRKATCLLISLLIVVGLVPAVSIPGMADDPLFEQIEYVDASGSVAVESCYVLDGSEEVLDSSVSSWYAVSSGVVFGKRLQVTGTVNLILVDDSTDNGASASCGITVSEGNTLKIWGQSGQTGILLCGPFCPGSAGLGSISAGQKCGTIEVYGGSVSGLGAYDSDGIATGIGSVIGGDPAVGTVTGSLKVYGGTVYAGTVSYDAVQLGNFPDPDSGKGICVNDLTVYDGAVESDGGEYGILTSGDFVINGGSVHSDSHGVNAGGILQLNGGRLSSNIKGSATVYAAGGIVIGDSVEFKTPARGRLSADGKTIQNADGSAVSENILIIPKPSLKSYAVTLTGQIGVDFDVLLSKDDIQFYSDSYMEFRINEETFSSVSFDNAVVRDQEKGIYRFTCYVSSVQMAETITPVFHYADGRTVEFASRSVANYVRDVTNDPGTYSLTAINLCKALSDYGYYITPFIQKDGLGVPDDVHMIEGSYREMNDADIATARSGVEAYKLTKSGSTGVISNGTYALLLGSETTIRLKFTAESVDTISVKLGTTELPVERVEISNEGMNYTLKIKNINAAQLADMYTVTVADDDGNEAMIKVSALSYADTIFKSGKFGNDSIAVEAMASLYYYYLAAAAYLSN
ncbi:MAG: hypothetical protein IJU57_03465 [Clostridia bacterium]|nr:hypothetical protein [Clostridia bacterium]